MKHKIGNRKSEIGNAKFAVPKYFLFPLSAFRFSS
jgi:hypothetical protein